MINVSCFCGSEVKQVKWRIKVAQVGLPISPSLTTWVSLRSNNRLIFLY